MPETPTLDPVVQAVLAYKRESMDAKKESKRDAYDQRNRNAFHGVQDLSNKQEGQSKEFLPKTAMAVEQMASFIKKGLVDFGDWFQVVLTKEAKDIISEEDVRRLLLCLLNSLAKIEENRVNFPTVISDGIKAATMQSLMIFKIHGRAFSRKGFVVERPTEGSRNEEFVVRFGTKDSYHLLVDPIESTDYFPDPSGRNLYQIHHIERDLHQVQELADKGIYDKDVVALLTSDMARKEEEALKKISPDERHTKPATVRKRVQLDECWGTILDDQGKVLHENIVTTIANDQWKIREEEDNPLWHGQSPFVVVPLFRVPFSVWHKALLDHAVPLNFALNELFNLMLDGGIAAVHGIKQLRADWLESPEEVSGGIPQGKTLTMNDSAPPQGKVVELVASGNVPQDALAMFHILDREHQTSMALNDIKLGNLPPRAVKATEVAEASQNSATFIDGLIRDLEDIGIKSILYKAWVTVVQHIDEIRTEDLAGEIGEEPVLALKGLSEVKRFQLFVDGCQFQVNGLSAILQRARDFQKVMAFLQAMSASPLLLETFFREASTSKLLKQLLKMLNLDPDRFKPTDEEQETAQERLQNASALRGIAGNGSGTVSGTGGDSIESQINQQTQNPLAGLDRIAS